MKSEHLCSLESAAAVVLQSICSPPVVIGFSLRLAPTRDESALLAGSIEGTVSILADVVRERSITLRVTLPMIGLESAPR